MRSLVRKARKVYLNAKQKVFIQFAGRFKVFLGGRATGKSTVLAVFYILLVKSMPGGHFFLSSSTYGQIATKTMASMISMWNRMGFKEGIHFVVGKAPPEWYSKCASPPKRWGNTVAWWNGSVISMISLDRPEVGLGGNFQGGAVDEVQETSEHYVKKTLVLATRGERLLFGKCPYYRQIALVGTPPWKTKGRWLYQYDAKAVAHPDKYKVVRSTTLDNVAVLGQDFIDDMKLELTPRMYRMEVLGEDVTSAETRFYNQLDEDRHPFIPTYRYEVNDLGPDVVAGVKEYWPDQLLEISFDFGGWFSCATIWQTRQEGGRTVEYMIDCVGIKGEKQMVSAVVASICKTYHGHRRKAVRVWGEPRGHNRQNNDVTNFERIKLDFARAGWRTDVAIKPVRTALHVDRHQYMNRVLEETDTSDPIVRMNQVACADPLIALASCEVKPDFKKDKGPEGDPLFPQEHAPHYTDTFDYYLYYKHKMRMHLGGHAATGGSSKAGFA